MTELKDVFKAFDNLIDAEDNSETQKAYLLFHVITQISDKGAEYAGKHGTGLMTKQEFTDVVEFAYVNDQLSYKPH